MTQEDDEPYKALPSSCRPSLPYYQQDGATPLFMAAQNGHLKVVRALVEVGADLSMCMSGNGWSPLFVAAWSGHAPVVSELLQRGADRTAATTKEHLGIPAGATALSVAQLKGHQAIVDLLNGESQRPRRETNSSQGASLLVFGAKET